MKRHIIELLGLKPYEGYGPSSVFQFPYHVDGYIVKIGTASPLHEWNPLYCITFTPAYLNEKKYGVRVSEEFLLDVDMKWALKTLLHNAKLTT